MILDHYKAFTGLLEGVQGLPAVEEAARVTDSGEPVRANYVVAFPPRIPSLNDRRYSVAQSALSTAQFRFDVRPVGTTATTVLRFTDLILADLIGDGVTAARLVVAGRACDPMRLVEGVEEGATEYDRTARLYYMDFTIEVVSRRI